VRALDFPPPPFHGPPPESTTLVLPEKALPHILWRCAYGVELQIPACGARGWFVMRLAAHGRIWV